LRLLLLLLLLLLLPLLLLPLLLLLSPHTRLLQQRQHCRVLAAP
jgi:hypothetical protein